MKSKLTEHQINELQKTADRLSMILKPAMEAQLKIINSKSFQLNLRNYQKQIDSINKLYQSTAWKRLVEQQTRTYKAILKAYKNIDTTGLTQYKNLIVNNNFCYKENVEVQEPSSRVHADIIRDFTPAFKKKAEEKKDEETVKLIKKIEECQPIKQFIVYFNRNGELFLQKNRDKNVHITSDKLIKLVSILANSNRYIPTEELMFEAGYENIRSVRNAIATLRKKFKGLGFLNEDPIDGKQGHGYILHRDIRLMSSPTENF